MVRLQSGRFDAHGGTPRVDKRANGPLGLASGPAGLAQRWPSPLFGFGLLLIWTSWSSRAVAKSGVSNVMSLQEALFGRGFDPGPIDGLMGPRTSRAISNFQQSAGLPTTGHVTDETFEALYDTVTAAPLSPVEAIPIETAYGAPASAFQGEAPLFGLGPCDHLMAFVAGALIAGFVVWWLVRRKVRQA